MSKELQRRLAALEAAVANPAYVAGWIITRDGELIGFAPSFGRPDPALAAWLAQPAPGFVFLIARDVTDTPAEDLAAMIPAKDASDQARRMAEPYTQPGAALHTT